MAKPSSPHDTMREAFVLRLKQLFPEPLARYREEREWPLGNRVRKPDVLLIHPDGKQWVFEMVHGNHHIGHMVESHQIYANAGIQDHWILWETLSPSTKAKDAPLHQRIMPNIGWEWKKYRLTVPQQAILRMQSGEKRFLHTFTSNYNREQEPPDIAFGQLMMVGVVTYQFERWAGEKEYLGKSMYSPISDLQFDACGMPISSIDGISEKLIERAMTLAGIDPDEERTVAEINDLLGEVTGLQEALSRLKTGLVQAAIEQLSTEEQLELAAFLQSKPEMEPIYQSKLRDEDLSQLLNRADVMDLAGKEVQQVLPILDQLPIPEALKKMLHWMMDAEKMISYAAFLRWQDESTVLGNTRK